MPYLIRPPKAHVVAMAVCGSLLTAAAPAAAVGRACKRHAHGQAPYTRAPVAAPYSRAPQATLTPAALNWSLGEWSIVDGVTSYAVGGTEAPAPHLACSGDGKHSQRSR